METKVIQISTDGRTRITQTSIGLTVDYKNDIDNWVTMDVEVYGTDNIEESFEHYSGEEAQLYDDDRLEVSVEKVGGYQLHMESGINLFKMDVSRMPESENAIEEIFSSKTGHYRTVRGVEGCPGRWYTASIDVLFVDDIYNYALIGVRRDLDV